MSDEQSLSSVIDRLSLSLRSVYEFEGFTCGWLIGKLRGKGYWDLSHWLEELALSYGDEAEESLVLDTDEQTVLSDYFSLHAFGMQKGDYRVSLGQEYDDLSLYARVIALQHWLQGLLYGLGVAGGGAMLDRRELGELLEDLTAFSRVEVQAADFGEADKEEDEADFMQIEEHLHLFVHYLLEEVPLMDSEKAQTPTIH
jgi:uncharacterized protein YgfB (UPF0149 family)